jgi:hypothetical protein
MKRILYLAIATTIISSCKKDEVKTTPLTSINITNAVVGGTTAKLGSNATAISNNGYAPLAVVAGTNSLYVYPVGDSAHPYYTNDKFTSNDREVYSMFLGGIPTAVDAIMVKETIPYRTDSTAGIRFINLANNNGALNVTLSTTPAVNEVTGLAYKSLTEFKTYPGLYNSAPTFQVRKADGTLLTSFAFTTSTVPRFANVTLVIRPNGTGVSVFRVNNDR